MGSPTRSPASSVLQVSVTVICRYLHSFQKIHCALFFTWFSTLFIVFISGTTLLPSFLCPRSSVRHDMSLITFASLSQFSNICSKVWCFQSCYWGNLSIIQYYRYTLSGYRRQRPLQVFLFHNSNTLPYTLWGKSAYLAWIPPPYPS